jgi:hypothetical protein
MRTPALLTRLLAPTLASTLVLWLAPACGGPDDGTRELDLSTPDLTDIASGADITFCSYLDAPVDQDLDIVSFTGHQTEYGHHTILFGVRTARPAGTRLCDESDMINVRFLAGSAAETGTQDTPAGVAFRLRQGEQLMIQSHFINTSDQTITGRSWFEVEAAPPDPSRQPADLFTVVSTDVHVDAHATGSAHASCPIGADTQLVMLAGHAHEWGTHVAIHQTAAGGAPVTLYDQDWSPTRMFDPVIERYPATQPLRFAPGDTVTVDCDYANDTDQALEFPREMCVAWGYYFPADHELDCVDGHWPGA